MSPGCGEGSEDRSQPETSLLAAAAGRHVLPGLTLLDLAIWLGLILSIGAVYLQVGGFDFISSDDAQYVTENPHVSSGLTLAGIKWMLTGVTANNWMPVTMFSHALDAQLFGLQSGMHHLVNVLLHAASAVLLFVLLRRATGARAASAFVAFVFALHPLHVESVAWISERKDVLSAFFGFLTLYCYVRYAEQPGPRRYLLVVAAFCLGLMSKPMLVTLPCALLLFDVWPLRRVQWPKILLEKLPLFALAACACVVTYRVQHATGAIEDALPLNERIANALTSYVIYLRQTFWPAHLASFYPFPRRVPPWHAAAALALLAAVSALALAARRTRPWFVVGWFWYLGTLIPVIGLVQAGAQSHADRYTYMPMVGLAVILAWGAADVASQRPRIKPALATAGAAFLGLSLVLAWAQTTTWRNEETLYRHALQETEGNWYAHNNLGAYLMADPQRSAEAVEQLEAALRIRPDYADANDNLGMCLARVNLCRAAIPHFEAALRARPDDFSAKNNLASCLIDGGQYTDAVALLAATLRAQPDLVEARYNLGRALSNIAGRDADAVAQYEAALRLRPDFAEAHRNLGQLLDRLGRAQEARSHMEAAQRIVNTQSAFRSTAP